MINSDDFKVKSSPNRLISENSPYLLQHAYNPVNWYPWGDEAFKKAEEEDKPVFLSIGYSTCHWCHVMEKESFEDKEIARLMNEAFICIKVDKEERPDIDNVYMKAGSLISGRGGWPLTIIMTPDKKPFFAGTYIPKESRYGFKGMRDLIPHITGLWQTKREDLLDTARSISELLQQPSYDPADQGLGEKTLHKAFDQLVINYDQIHGGFGERPKFPSPHVLLFLLRYWDRTENDVALLMVEKTLKAMREGGLYDHLGYGFHRYSTDSRWLLPHFEKMLYDQSMLAMAYIEAYQVTGNKKYEQTAREIFTYVLRDMTDSSGGFYSAEDADSEGEEGEFYLWTVEEIQSLLSPEDAEFVVKKFNLSASGNFKDESTGRKNGKNILHLDNQKNGPTCKRFVPRGSNQNSWEDIRKTLFEAREKRIHPFKDDKILTDWNGLMIAALAKGSRVFREKKYSDAAKKAFGFIMKNMRSADDCLLHSYRGGKASVKAFVDDYVFLIWGLIELYETTFEVGFLEKALELNDELLYLFWDEKEGGFYHTSEDGEELIARRKEIYDGAIPSGNSVAMMNLLRLGRITAKSDLEDKSKLIADHFATVVDRDPSAFAQLMVALNHAIGPSKEIIISGKNHDPITAELKKVIGELFLPNAVVLYYNQDPESPDIGKIAPYTENLVVNDSEAKVYICSDFTCKKPVKDVVTLLKELEE